MVSEATTRLLKELAREIFLDALAQVDVRRAFEGKVERVGARLCFGAESVELDAFRRRWVVSIGKAAEVMTRALLETLGEPYWPERGVVASNVAADALPPGFLAYQSGHPIPDANSVRAAESILELLRGADEKTLVFFLLSGGGSALVEKPLHKELTLGDVQELYRVLVGCGASISAINAIRKHLSAVKGGRLAELAPRARQIAFIVSDVPDGQLDAVCSGPTLPDPTTVETCYEVAERYQLLPRFPPAIRRLFDERKLEETPKTSAAAFAGSQIFLLLSQHDVLHAAHRAAGARGFLAEVEMGCDDWELEKAADFLLRRLEQMQQENPGQPVAVISGGEVLCPVRGDGRGGRNQEFALYCVERIAGRQCAVLSAGTDGIDGNSPAAGAVADGETLARARAQRLEPGDFHRRSDSFTYFEALGDTIVTGPQQNNLRDLRLLLAR